MEMITLRCKTCGHEVTRPVCCPYTGHRHGNGWSYVCDTCRGQMIEVEPRGYVCECEKALDFTKPIIPYRIRRVN